MNKAYNRINWENYPSLETPVNEQNLNKMDSSLDEIDNRIILQDTTKFDKSEAQYLVKNVILDEDNGILTIQYYNGAEKKYSSLLGKITINFDFDRETQKIILYKPSGEAEEIDLSAFITEYEFADSGTIAFSVGEDGEVSAIVKEGSIEEKHLQPNYLADIKVEAAKAETAAASAESSKTAAAGSASTASTKASEAATSASNAAASATTATQKATEAGTSATNAENSATSASTSATTATNKANAAATSATNAANSATTATTKANAASISATNAANSATNAETYAKQAQSYAVGTGNVRPNEATDSSKYYYEQAKAISESFAGALRPMGTVTFANLPALTNAFEGDMYNVSNQFETTADFKEGSGHVIPAGSNVYKTADNKWDILAGTPVTSVNGQTGNVNITKRSIGLENVDNTADAYKSVNYANSAGKVLNSLKITKTGATASTIEYYDGSAEINITESDYKVYQENSTTNTDYRLLFSASANDTSETKPARKSNKAIFNPSTGELKTTKLTGDAEYSTVTYTSEDTEDMDATSWTSIPKITSGMKLRNLFLQISRMFKNARYLYKMLGTTDISSIGDGTVTNAIVALNNKIVGVVIPVQLDASGACIININEKSGIQTVSAVVGVGGFGNYCTPVWSVVDARSNAFSIFVRDTGWNIANAASSVNLIVYIMR